MDINFSRFATSFAEDALIQSSVTTASQPVLQADKNIIKPATIPVITKAKDINENKCPCNLL